ARATGAQRVLGGVTDDRSTKAVGGSTEVGTPSLLLPHQGSFPARYPRMPGTSPFCPLDPNHSVFFLVDNGTQGQVGGEASFRARLERYIAQQKVGTGGLGSIEIPVLLMLIGGDATMFRRVSEATRASIPCLLLGGSGGAADCLARLLEETSKCGSLGGICCFTPLIPPQVERIGELRELVTVYSDQEGLEEFETVLLKALVKACQGSHEASSYLDELRLAVAWNRVDIASSELFREDVLWQPSLLEGPMRDALLGDRPALVRLFVENGLDVGQFLTWGRLEELYMGAPEASLLCQLLTRRHGGPAEPSPPPDYLSLERAPPDGCLPLVAHILRELLGDVCAPFYVGLHPPGQPPNKVSLVDWAPSYRDELSPNPWTDLFIWAVLLNRREMATYCWEMVSESQGSSGLSGSGLGSRVMMEGLGGALDSRGGRCVSAPPSQCTHSSRSPPPGVFGECYRNSEPRVYKLLVRRSQLWGSATVLQLAHQADARLFFAQDGVQSLLTQNWWGEMDRSTPVWQLLLTFFCPPLIFTDLITFRWVLQVGMFTQQNRPRLGGRSCPDAPVPHVPRHFWLRRWRQFWGAPVTAFLGNVVMYLLFLLLFSYVLLMDFAPPPPDGPSGTEIVLYVWVFTLVCEEVRQGCFVGTQPLAQRVWHYLQDTWNQLDIAALLLFMLGLGCRLSPWTYESGRTILCLDFMVFTLRLIHIFAVNKQLGPKMIIVGKMIKDVGLFLFFLGVWLVAYGVTTEGLLHPHDRRLPWIFRRVFYRPYLQIFGQIPLNEIDGDEHARCVSVRWKVWAHDPGHSRVTQQLCKVFSLLPSPSYTFSKVQGNSDIYWKSQRYSLILEYHSRPTLAPPFIVFSHLHLIVKRYVRKVQSAKGQHFLLDLSEVQDGRLLTWESVQKETFLVAQARQNRERDTERLRRTSQKVDMALKQLSEIRESERRLRTLETQVYDGEPGNPPAAPFPVRKVRSRS
uniref:Transient receptor potential cation channel subfamily M member 4 n=1 Tax=Sphenodon punctatus TaxID=8508 RepID=A0A8D0GRP7_SPHPU